MKNNLRSAMACVGAVIGAGFASGREIAVFFSRFGGHSWWLIVLTSTMMALLCGICMKNGETQNQSIWAQLAFFLLLAVTGGAMTSAAGQMIALVWPSEWAYSLSVVGTLMMAWLSQFCQIRVLGWSGSVLSVLLIAAIVSVTYVAPKGTGIVFAAAQPDAWILAGAAVKAIGYAAMNITLASGAIWRCAQNNSRTNGKICILFGGVMTLLLCMSNSLYLRHTELLNDAFPMVRLLSAFGRNGFLISVLLLYLAILTTLIAVIGAMRITVARHIPNSCLQMLVTLGLPLCLSAAGFSGIVERVYAPAGWLCLLLCHAGTKNQRPQTQEMLDKRPAIQ